MPFPVAHGIIAASFFVSTRQTFSIRKDGKWLLLCAAFALVPDLDFFIDWALDVREWHRGFTHSLVFGTAFGLFGTALVPAKTALERFGVALAIVSHALADWLVTWREKGVELLWPFSHNRFSFGWVDYFSFPFHPRYDPWIEICFYISKISILEIILLGPVLIILVVLKSSKR